MALTTPGPETRWRCTTPVGPSGCPDGQVMQLIFLTLYFSSGYLKDGTRFDSSRSRNKPFKFKLGFEQVRAYCICCGMLFSWHWLRRIKVIPGLDLGVAQLSIGERAKLTIPSILAYGEKGFPGLWVLSDPNYLCSSPFSEFFPPLLFSECHRGWILFLIWSW